MSFLRPSLLLLCLSPCAVGCSSSKEDGQRLLSRLGTVLEKSTEVLTKIQDRSTAVAAAGDLETLTEQWTALRDFDQKFKFSRSTMEQLLNDNAETRNKVSDLKLKFTQEYERVHKLEINTPELQAFEKAFARFLQK